MKKLVKTAALAVLMISLLGIGAFAQNKTIEWDFSEDVFLRETFSYGGELEVGSNEVTPLTEIEKVIFGDYYSDNVYYEFDVPESGYYDFETVSDAYYTVYISQDIRDGIVYGDTECLTVEDDGVKVYLEEGECKVGLVFYFYDWNGLGDIYNSELNIEFFGSEITDFQIEEEYLEDLILGCHIGSESDENNTAYIFAEGKLVFDSGRECDFYGYLDIEYSDDIAPGENTVTVVLSDYRKDYTVQIKTVDDYIKDIEVGNIGDMTVVRQSFIPEVVFTPDTEYTELIITYPDGTKKTEIAYDGYSIELKGDKYLWITYDYVQHEDGKWYFTVAAMDKEYVSVPCETVEASFDENCGLYFNYVLEYAIGMTGEVSWYLSDAFDMLSGLSAGERMECVSAAFSEIGEYYAEVYELTGMFMSSVL